MPDELEEGPLNIWMEHLTQYHSMIFHLRVPMGGHQDHPLGGFDLL